MKKEAKALIWYISILNVDIDWWRRFVVRKERKVWVYSCSIKGGGNPNCEYEKNELHPIGEYLRQYEPASITSPYVMMFSIMNEYKLWNI